MKLRNKDRGQETEKAPCLKAHYGTDLKRGN